LGEEGLEFRIGHDALLRLAVRTLYKRSVKPPSFSKSCANRST